MTKKVLTEDQVRFTNDLIACYDVTIVVSRKLLDQDASARTMTDTPWCVVMADGLMSAHVESRTFRFKPLRDDLCDSQWWSKENADRVMEMAKRHPAGKDVIRLLREDLLNLRISKAEEMKAILVERLHESAIDADITPL